ncbi:MAG: DUF99 family protein [Candidatus Thermoplasmatota archaeon]|nr:DUF99 family protein [Euryarchaeota archaeon]MBU4032769.1 DUF99 family protein [Candidatus Thermoplasmatota archaeon]MBU4072219.1 DUF99 family protein [Candidatus Thermoplasmatota archaeon]MBU4143968.1 DUF99 family protein [Candidatus Thermoplasmatota archaeon]MBU4591918.1 DUF99 family protein [Candidatus Thermoplasmatota archaeon]
MKTQIRILAIDDGPFSFGEERATVVGVAMRLPGYVEGVMVTDVKIDGLDSTDRILEMLHKSRYMDQVKLIILDGVAFGGFNVLDVNHIHERTGIPVATVTRDRPNYDEIRKALIKHFDDWQERLNMMTATDLEEFETEHTPIFVGRIGIEREKLAEILAASTAQGALPEALRVAHLIATAIARGESRGRA